MRSVALLVSGVWYFCQTSKLPLWFQIYQCDASSLIIDVFFLCRCSGVVPLPDSGFESLTQFDQHDDDDFVTPILMVSCQG